MRLKFKIVFMAAIICLAVVSVLAGLGLFKLREGVELRKQASIAQGKLDDVLESLQEAQIHRLRARVDGDPQELEAMRQQRQLAVTAFDAMSRNHVTESPEIAAQMARLHQLMTMDQPLNAEIRKEITAVDKLLEQEVNAHQLFVDKYFNLNLGALVLFLLFAVALLFAFALLVSDEIRRRARLEEDLRMAQATAVSASNLKSQFVATVSHEIRTPLNGIIGMSELVRDRVQGAELKRYAQTLHKSGQDLLRIVNDILDFSKIEANRFDFELQEVRPAHIVENAVELFAKRAADKKLLVIGNYGRDFQDVYTTDGSRLAQVLHNLLSNAIKFTDRGAVQVLGAVERDGENLKLRFDVYDTGCGFRPEDRRLLFQPFNQLAGARTKEGTGLGLTICKRLVENMGGEIGVSSQLGRGSHFWFTVPVRLLRPLVMPSPEPSAAPVRACGFGLPPELDRFLRSNLNLVGIDYRGDGPWPQNFTEADFVFVKESIDPANLPALTPYSPRILRLPEQVTPERLQRSLRMAHQGSINEPMVVPVVDENRESALLLLVEDNSTNQLLAQALLEGMGYRVHVAGNGQEGLDAVRRVRYNLVLMDCSMPVMDGFAATRQIREMELQDGLPRLPIVAMTANMQAGDREKCLAAGMDDYIAKPFEPQVLAQTVGRWVQVGKPALDWGIVKGLAERTNGDVVRRLMDSMVGTLAATIPRLEEGFKGENWSEVSGLAHQLKASSATLGALRFSELCESIETQIDTGAKPSEEQLSGMIRTAQQVLEEIRSRRLFK